MTRRLRIFLSSPGDVSAERLRAQLIVQKLARDYARFFDISVYLWEHEPMLASGHFQDVIESPSQSDIVVLVVYSRLGTPLPERTNLRRYAGIDGRTPVTGTEWEFEEALAAKRDKGAPDLLAYRRIGDPGVSLTDAAKRAEQEHQWAALDSFWRRHFEDQGLFLAGSARYETLEDFDRKLEADLKALIERRAAQLLGEAGGEAAASPATWLKGSPFRGLAAYEFEHAPVFFGRELATRNALTRLQAAGEKGCGFLLVIGASGSGKSSLARAGLLPALVAPHTVESVGLWRRVVMRPGQAGGDPVAALVAALLDGDAAQGVGLPELAGPGVSAADLVRHMRTAAADASLPIRAALGALAQSRRESGRLLAHEQARLVLLVDQFEELVTLPAIRPADRELFVQVLAGLVRSGVVWVVATLRSDLWHAASAVPGMLDLVESGARIDLLPPDGSELIEMIRQPAAAAGLAFGNDPESGIGLDAMLASAAASEAGALPLLSVMLDALYDRDVAQANAAGRSSNLLTVATYRALGELKGAIAERAEEIFTRLGDRDAEAATALPDVLRALVTAGSGGTAITSRAAPLSQFPDGSPERRLVEALVAPEARLLTIESWGEASVVRVAHEALIANWPRAVEQLRRDRRDIETRARLEAMLEGWRAASASDKPRALLDGLALEEGLDLARRWELPGAEPLGAFIGESHRHARRRRLRTLVASVAGIFVLASAAVAWFAVDQSRRIEAAERVATAEQKRAGEALEAARRQRELTEVAEANRARADQARKAALVAEADRVAALAQQLATANEAHLAAGVALGAAPLDSADERPMTDRLAIALSRAVNAARLPIQRDLVENAFTLAASPDGKYVASGTNRGVVHVFDAETMAEIMRVQAGNDVVAGLAFSPDSGRLVVAGDKIPSVWSVTDKRKLFDLARPGAFRFSKQASFSPDGTRILIGTAENRALLHDASDGRLLSVLPGSTYQEMAERRLAKVGRARDPLEDAVSSATFQIWGVATDAIFSPDGKLVAVTGQANTDDSVRLFDAATGELVRVLAGGEGPRGMVPPMSYGKVIAFSADGSSLIAAPTLDSIKVWDVRNGRLKVDLPSIGAGTFILTGDGRAVLSGQRNGAIIGRCIEGPVVVQSVQAHSNDVEVLAVDPSGRYLISGSRDRSARVWIMPAGEDICSTTRYASKFEAQRPIAVFPGHGARITGAAMSADLTRVLTSSQDGYVRNWRLHPVDVTRFEPGESGSSSLSDRPTVLVSGDGKHLFSTDGFGWQTFDLEAGKQVELPDEPQQVAPGAAGRPALLIYGATKAFEMATLPQPPPSTEQEKEPARTEQDADSEIAKILREMEEMFSGKGGSSRMPRRSSPQVELRDLSVVLAASPDGSRVVTLDEERHRLVDRASGAIVSDLMPETKRTVRYSFSGDGSRLLAVVVRELGAGNDDQIDGLVIWDVATGRRLFSADKFPGLTYGRGVSLSHDGGRLLLHPEGSTPAALHALNGDRMETLPMGATGASIGKARELSAVALAADGQSVYAGHSDGYISIVGVGDRSRDAVRSFDTGGAGIRLIAATVDGRRFAAADAANTVWIIDGARGVTLRSMTLPRAPAEMVFTAQGDRLIVVGAGDVTVLPVDPGVPGLVGAQARADWARAVQLTALDDEEQRRYGITLRARARRPDLEKIPGERPERLDPTAVEEGYQRAARLAIDPAGASRVAEALSEMAKAGIPNRAWAAALAAKHGSQLARTAEERARALFVALLAIEFDETVEDPAPADGAAYRAMVRDLVRELGGSLPPPVVVQAYREARDWRFTPRP